MEHGGNNRGAQVEAIIKANGGDVGEPWCGDFVAHCARTAGSTAVTRAWASVRALRTIAGVHPTTKPTPGDLVTFTFDHVGIYVGNHGNEIETIEGNTGSSGAVSDSANGGDGVYRKRRAKSLVHEYLHLTR
jgi:cell wall-associated NlpC family hydrolase